MKYLYSLFIILFLAMGTTSLHSYSLYDIGLGTEVSHHDTRTTAMGSSGVAGGFRLFDSSLNPANLYFLEDDGSIQMSYSLIKNSENRAIPLWNFFDSYVDESTYARNETFFNEVVFGANYSLDVGESRLSAGYIFRPVVNFGAEYKEDVRNAGNSHNQNYPPILAKNFIDVCGLLLSHNLLINWGMPLPFDDTSISIGAELSYLTGDYEYERRIHWTDTAHRLATNPADLVDNYSLLESKMDGIAMKFGLSSQITERWRVGVAFSPKVSLETETKTQDDFYAEKVDVEDSPDYIIPTKLRMGFLFRPRNKFRTNFQFDFEMIAYSEIDKFYEDGYAFYVGMEHYIGRAMPLRIGFSHRSAKQDKSISLPTVSAGTGFPILSNIQFDIAGEYGKREYSDLDLFPDGFYNKGGLWPNNHTPTSRGWEAPDAVTESFWKIFTSVSYKF